MKISTDFYARGFLQGKCTLNIDLNSEDVEIKDLTGKLVLAMSAQDFMTLAEEVTKIYKFIDQYSKEQD